MDPLTKHLVEIIETCVARGMAPPFLLCAVGRDGGLFAIRVSPDHDPEVLVDHLGSTIQFPINIMIVDPTGEAVRVTIDATEHLVTHH